MCPDPMASAEPLLTKKTEFDVLCASPGSGAAHILEECGYRARNLVGISFSDGGTAGGFPAERSEWLAIDVGSISGDYFIAGSRGREAYVPCGRFPGKEPDGSAGRIGFQSIPSLDARLDVICEAIGRFYGKKTVAIDLRDPLWIMDGGGNVRYRGNPDEDRIESAGRCLLGFMERLGCFCVRTPSNIIAAETGAYVPEFRAYAESCLDAMVSGENARRRMFEMGIDLAARMDTLRGENYLQDQNAIRRSDRQWNACNKKDGVDRILEAVIARSKNAKSAEARGELERRAGIIWKDRKDGRADYRRAAEWMRRSAESDTPGAKSDLLDILWREGSDDSLLEMVALAREMSAKGSPKGMLVIGRAYRDGKGLPKSRENAVRWLAEASATMRQAEIELKALLEAGK